MTQRGLWLVLILTSLGGDSGEVELKLTMPAKIRRGEQFQVSFTVTNKGQSGFYFKQPWKWATNALYLRAEDSSGHTYESAPRLFDVSANEVCTFLKPLGPGDSFTFREVVGGEIVHTQLPLPSPGHYRVKWIYDPRHDETEQRCVAGDWPVFRGKGESPAAEVDVQ